MLMRRGFRALALSIVVATLANDLLAQDQPKPIPTPIEYAATYAGEQQATILTLLGKLHAQAAEIAALREQLAKRKAEDEAAAKPADKP